MAKDKRTNYEKLCDLLKEIKKANKDDALKLMIKDRRSTITEMLRALRKVDSRMFGPDEEEIRQAIAKVRSSLTKIEKQ